MGKVWCLKVWRLYPHLQSGPWDVSECVQLLRDKGPVRLGNLRTLKAASRVWLWGEGALQYKRNPGRS